MGWPYQFLDLDAAAKQARRQSLDRHATYAQVSALLPVVLFLLYRLGRWLVAATKSQRGSYSAVPDSPVLKRQRQSAFGAWAGTARRVVWWFGDDVVFFGQNWGQRDQMIAGVAWTLWLLFFCIVGTGNDYLHLTKRFGIVAVSQFPVQYLLALKNLNPFSFAFHSSHEQVNRWHRVLGRIIYGLLLLHACFYLNFYIQQGILADRLVHLVPILGVAAFLGLSLLSGTALSAVRVYSYRIFFITHLLVALAIPPMIFFHASHSSFYVGEALLVFFADLAKRKIDTVTAEAALETIPGTDLIKITAEIPSQKVNSFSGSPGAHIYLNIPAASRPGPNPASTANLLYEFAFNPFTIAAVNENSGDLTLVARYHNGPMTRTLAGFANPESGNAKRLLSIEGPYGCATRFPNLAGSGFDRVLLVAGGIGATFILPIYHAIMHENSAARVQMIWAVRAAGDATWPVSDSQQSILADDNIQLFLTGDMFENGSNPSAANTEGEGVEMDTIHKDRRRRNRVQNRSQKRPNLQKIVDDTFRQGLEDRVAVLVCGPEEMARELRTYVGVWVKKGRPVWWHNESFAW